MMEKSAEKNMLLLVLAGAVLVLANLAVMLGTRSGQMAPVDNRMLWAAFSILNIASLLWAVTLLGLHPLVVAVSYVTGGLLAYQGVRMTPGVNLTEIATAGATYSAFGALLAGNLTTRVRLTFFARSQVPFVFIILTLLVVDGVLNSRLSQANWHIISLAAIYPFLFSGVVVGLVWMLMERVRGEKRPQARRAEQAVPDAAADSAVQEAEAPLLHFSVPDALIDQEPDAEEPFVAMPAPALTETEPIQVPEVTPLASTAHAEPEEEVADDTFFPLEIDSSDEQASVQENPELISVAAMLADSARILSDDTETAVAPEPEPKIDFELPIVEAMPPVKTVEEEPIGSNLKKEKKAGPEDWLNSHLELLSKLK